MKKIKKSTAKGSASKNFPLRPLADRIIVKEIKEEGGKETKSGIFIPETANKESASKKGKVVAVGQGKYDDGKLITPEVKVGDTVLFPWGEKVEVEGEEYYVVRDAEIMAIINN